MFLLVFMFMFVVKHRLLALLFEFDNIIYCVVLKLQHNIQCIWCWYGNRKRVFVRSTVQMIIQIDQPLANDHLDGSAFCRWSTGWNELVQEKWWNEPTLFHLKLFTISYHNLIHLHFKLASRTSSWILLPNGHLDCTYQKKFTRFF